MNKKYIVRLTSDERSELENLVKKGNAQAYRIKHAHILLAVDADGPGWMDEKTAVDWAEETQELLDKDYPKAEKVVLVCDNLNAHKTASFYEAFEPEEARRLIERLEIHYTPKHGSWLDVAEIELSIFTKQCLDRRIPDTDTLRAEAKAWYCERNSGQKSVDWQFTTDKARIKLKRLYPQIQMS